MTILSFLSLTMVAPDTEIAIVGSGPAGIVVALELARRGRSVVLVESGRSSADATVQALGDATIVDPVRHVAMNLATRRQLGGASNIWGGRCVPYDPVDFMDRPWIPSSSWPIGFDEVSRYHRRAGEWFRTGSPVFDSHQLDEMHQKTIVPGLPDGDVLTSTLERWSLPTNFAKEYARDLQATPGLRVLPGLTCVEVLVDRSGRRVTGLRCRRSDGEETVINASRYLIACGGLESTRLLLASDSIVSGGLGNQSGLLGRFYMGHASGKIAEVVFTTPPRDTAYAYSRTRDGVYVRQRFSFTSEASCRERLPNIVGWLVNPELAKPEHGSGILSFAYLALSSPVLGPRFVAEGIRRAVIGSGPRRVWPHVWNMLRDFPATAMFVPTFAYRRFLVRRKVPGFFVPSRENRYPLQYHAEHLPNRDSRVWLGEERDALGMRRLVIDLRFSPQDVAGVVRAHELWDRHLRRHACGHIEYSTADVPEAISAQLQDGYHQAGTTRMSVDPAQGVVTPDLRVHGIDNLYVLSGSVLVTSGQANTTFIVVALAVRLADHLAESAA
ncbi:MAG: GMC family oxidoreductase [Planctomycetia bacterium]|nr:GMC family oxidoreductase [Planctomycetia bacterium]